MELLSKVVSDFGDSTQLGAKDCDKRRQYGGVPRRSYQPIRRQSYLAGREGAFWRRTKRQDMRQVVLAAKRYELKTRGFGERSGALGAVALEVIDYMANLVDYRTGRLDPSIETLMKRLHRSRDAIVRALKNLRTHGFLDWLRRYVPTGNEGAGIRVKQTSNAYRLSMPARALRFLGRYGKQAPIPDDFVHAQAAQAAQIEAHRESLSNAELPLFDIEDERLSASLSRLGAMLDKKKAERESVKQTESLSNFFNKG